MKKIMKKRILFIFIISLLSGSRLFACSSFSFTPENSVVFGYNFDWNYSDALIFVNKRNVEKRSFSINKAEKKMKWISKYGSITVNQYGREFPHCGMNEAGLVISEMLLYSTQFPSEDSRLAFVMAQWVQYQLDNCATIEEVIATNSKIRIGRKEVPCQFLISDKSGNSITIEWLTGELVYHTGNKLPIAALTNETYEECLNFYLKNKNETVKESWSSSNARFHLIADMIEKYSNLSEKTSVEYSFDILESVRDYRGTSGTRWSIVYDVNNLRFYFKTKENRKLRSVDFSSFDFSSASPVMYLNINDPLSGNVSNHFQKYNHNENRTLLNNSYEKLGAGVPDKVLKRVAKYPKTTRNLDHPFRKWLNKWMFKKK